MEAPLAVGKSILICDDNQDTLSFMEFFLKAKGYAVCSASHFTELLACLEKQKFDLLIQDVRMPGMNGFEVMEELNRRNVTLPVLFATGVEPPQYASHPRIPGVREYIMKPFNNQALLERIEAMLGKRGP